jgi:hypothetical protein
MQQIDASEYLVFTSTEFANHACCHCLDGYPAVVVNLHWHNPALEGTFTNPSVMVVVGDPNLCAGVYLH